MKIRLVRHGETDGNARGLMLGTKVDWPLNEKGIAQAENLKLDSGFDFIFSSPLKRTLQTAEILSKTLGAKLIVHQGLIERDKGILEGKTQAEVAELTNGEVSEAVLYRKLVYGFSPYGGDSIETVEKRIKSFVADLLQNYSDKRVLVVTHLGIIRVMFLMYAGGPSALEGNGAINILDVH